MHLKVSRHGLFYSCERWPACDYTHGAHVDGQPLGTPGDKKTRLARTRAHAFFDQLWRRPGMNCHDRRSARLAAYTWLRVKLGLSDQECHIGRFDAATCERVVELCKERRSER
jgi:ssDNA-binding Zn-finger/Zn-ribbon topoisomerase 1